MEYNLTIKKNEVLIHATTWTNLENIMLSEISQSHMTIYYMLAYNSHECVCIFGSFNYMFQLYCMLYQKLYVFVYVKCPR